MVPHEVVENAIEEFVDKPEDLHGRAVAIVGVPDAQKGEALVLLSAVHHSNLTAALDDIRAHLARARPAAPLGPARDHPRRSHPHAHLGQDGPARLPAARLRIPRPAPPPDTDNP